MRNKTFYTIHSAKVGWGACGISNFLYLCRANVSWVFVPDRFCGHYGDHSSVGRALDCGSSCRGFDPHWSPLGKRPVQFFCTGRLFFFFLPFTGLNLSKF